MRVKLPDFLTTVPRWLLWVCGGVAAVVCFIPLLLLRQRRPRPSIMARDTGENADADRASKRARDADKITADQLDGLTPSETRDTVADMINGR